MKKLLTTVASLVLCIAIAMTYIGCSDDTTEAKASAFVSIDINPSIELTLDQNDKVLTIRGTNEDGQILLYGESGLVGLKVEDAISKITDLAVELGYLAEDNKVVDTTVTAKNEQDETELLNRINAKITAKAQGKGIEVRTDGQGAYSLLRSLEQLKAEYPNNQAIQNLTLKKFKLVLSASETGEITIEAAAELDDKELIKIVSNAHAKMKEYITDEYDRIKAKEQLAYDKIYGAAMDGVYIGHDLVNGTLYSLYKTTARVLNGVADILLTTENIAAYQIDENTVIELLTALNLSVEDIELIKNSDGEITLKSIYKYIDKLIKNTQDEQKKAEIKTAIENELSKIENIVKEKIQNASVEYSEEIKAVIKDAQNAIEKIPTIPVIEELSALLDDVLVALEDGLTYSEIRELATKFEDKAQSVKKNIEENLSNEQRNQIERRKENLISTIEQAKEKLNQSIDEIALNSRNRLEQLKTQRRAK